MNLFVIGKSKYVIALPFFNVNVNVIVNVTVSRNQFA